MFWDCGKSGRHLPGVGLSVCGVDHHGTAALTQAELRRMAPRRPPIPRSERPREAPHPDQRDPEKPLTRIRETPKSPAPGSERPREASHLDRRDPKKAPVPRSERPREAPVPGSERPREAPHPDRRGPEKPRTPIGGAPRSPAPRSEGPREAPHPDRRGPEKPLTLIGGAPRSPAPGLTLVLSEGRGKAGGAGVGEPGGGRAWNGAPDTTEPWNRTA
ncbi:PREDICTED: S-antigen protein-like isoform X1 [Condylura cristata]|uniref:S-antigen protein-like isoform X1 n=1 Tax=Condylura cristata TaxID=143302 RepID=UPI000643536C|nr:PREDICTED: S-antigen protein-like isoform X1 [Condylura cristata]